MDAASIVRSIGRAGISIAAALAIVALAVLPFLSPAWVAFEQGRADAVAWTGYAPAELEAATNGILADLVLGPPDFDVEVRGEPVLHGLEREHMRDVRRVFAGFYGAALVGGGILLAAGRLATRETRWRAIRRGAVGLAGGIVVVGTVAAVAFELAFEVFHRLFFSAGSYTFDPRTDRLVQLFPQRFWFETSLAVGAVILVLAVGTILVATRRLRNAARAKSPGVAAEPGVPAAPEPGPAR